MRNEGACRRSIVTDREREGERQKGKGDDALVVDSHFLAASAGSLCSVSGIPFSIRTLLLFHFVSFRFNFIMSQKWPGTRRTRGGHRRASCTRADTKTLVE